jgi:hypothetical protein
VVALPRPLAQVEHERLVDIIGCANPELLPLARDDVNARWLEDAECEALTNALMSVFLAHSGPNDEPDRYGATGDELIGLIEMQRPGYWDQ